MGFRPGRVPPGFQSRSVIPSIWRGWCDILFAQRETDPAHGVRAADKGMAAVNEQFREFAQKLGGRISRRTVFGMGYFLLLLITAYSAVIVKESRQALPLLALEAVKFQEPRNSISPLVNEPKYLSEGQYGPPSPDQVFAPRSVADSALEISQVSLAPVVAHIGPTRDMRWFNGRPVRPARTVRMVVTGYSPDARSCGDSADGYTATMHSVETNAFQLVAADPTVLPYGSMLTVAGYAGNLIVPVLDCGSKIKGNHIDILFKTHEQAMKWGVKHLTVTIWEYADGEPAENPRALR